MVSIERELERTMTDQRKHIVLMQQLGHERCSARRNKAFQLSMTIVLVCVAHVCSFGVPKSRRGVHHRDSSGSQHVHRIGPLRQGTASRWPQTPSCKPFLSTSLGAADGTTLGLHSSSPTSYTNMNTLSSDFKDMRLNVDARLRSNDFRGAFQGINDMFASLKAAKLDGEDQKDDIEFLSFSEEIDKAMLSFYNYAFSTPYRGRKAVKRVSMGMDALQLQLSSNILEAPYNSIPKRCLLDSLKALTRVRESRFSSSSTASSSSSEELQRADAAYRILQRLVTGVGIRNLHRKQKLRIHESDFNIVLNAYSNIGRMDMAHRVVALQERTLHAPPISPVAYSILIKGYGKLRDADNIDNLLDHANKFGMEPDVIMLNSLIDAYVNCGDLDKAMDLFHCMKLTQSMGGKEKIPSDYSRHTSLFAGSSDLRPNRRTYNTILKGLSRAGAVEDALKLSGEMEELSMWDAVTTNTLVQAAVKQRDFVLAERLLDDYTESPGERKHGGCHPNVEAYTTLLDGFAKSGRLTKALETLKLMGDRGVEPNEVTYSCMVGALARQKKQEEAYKMISFMQSSGVRPSVITYNSMISGLVAGGGVPATNRNGNINENFDSRVDEAIQVLRNMMTSGVRPNSATVSVLIDAFGRCEQPRVAEAKSLIAKLEADGVIAVNNTIVSTALVQVCGMGEDFDGAFDVFNKIVNPDVAAVNSFLDACCRCQMDKALLQAFKQYFQPGSSQKVEPDVISYSILITALLRKNLSRTTRQAFELYQEMKDQRRILPDKALVDM